MFMRIAVVTQIVPLGDNADGQFGEPFQLLADGKEGGVGIINGQKIEDFSGGLIRAVVKSQGDYLSLRFHVAQDIAAVLPPAGSRYLQGLFFA